MVKYGYGRVSTQGQDLGNQVSILMDQGVSKDNILTEKFTGKSKDRKKLKELLDTVQTSDEVYITKLDRLARSLMDLKHILEQFENKGVTVIFIQDKITSAPENNSPMDNLTLNLLGSFAEFERDLIYSRMQEGKEYARKNNPNYKEGRPKRKLTPKHLHVVELLEKYSFREVAKRTGYAKSTVQSIKKQYDQEVAEGKRKPIKV